MATGVIIQSLDVQGILTLLLTLLKFLKSLHKGITVRSRPFKEVVSFEVVVPPNCQSEVFSLIKYPNV